MLSYMSSKYTGGSERLVTIYTFVRALTTVHLQICYGNYMKLSICYDGIYYLSQSSIRPSKWYYCYFISFRKIPVYPIRDECYTSELRVPFYRL